MTIAIVLAAGQGKRMGAKINKQYLLLQGKPVLAHTLAVFERTAAIAGVIVVAQASEIAYCQREIVERGGYHKVMAVVAGGRERQDSVYQALLALPADCQQVVVHDGARPLVTPAQISQVVAAIKPGVGAVLGVPVKDTIKRVDEAQMVLETPERATLWAVQTPQGFERAQLLAAYEQALAAQFYGTDDASLVERAGGQVQMVRGSYDNLKMTTPEDLMMAEGILQARAASQEWKGVL